MFAAPACSRLRARPLHGRLSGTLIEAYRPARAASGFEPYKKTRSNSGQHLFDVKRLWLVDWESAYYANDPLVDKIAVSPQIWRAQAAVSRARCCGPGRTLRPNDALLVGALRWSVR